MLKPRSRHEDLREACIREATKIIGEDGLEALSLRDVARHLGVSHQAPYKHFPTRDHLLAEIVGRAYSAFAEQLDARVPSEDPFEDLGRLGAAYLEYAKRHPLSYKLMFGTPLPSEDAHPQMMKKARHAFGVLRSIVARLPGQRTQRQIDLDALFAWSAVHGLASITEMPAAAQAGFGPEALEHSSRHILKRIADALGAPGHDR
jgi:AcrR family transcriptional regulator